MISNRTNSKKADAIDSYHHDAGKGSLYRPSDRERFYANWDNIFGKKDQINENQKPNQGETK